MNDYPADRIEAGSGKIPDVLRTLAGVLPQFEGEGLESQLQTFDTFLEILSPSVRPQISSLLRKAASSAQVPSVRLRIQAAAESVAKGGRAAEPYNHAETMQAYQESFRKSFPDVSPSPSPSSSSPQEKRTHPRLLAQLDQIEAEMKRIGYWSNQPPDLQAAVDRGEIKSFLDAPTFELWLQMLFLPHARQAVMDDKLPKGSQVGEMARRQYDYMSVDYNAEQLLRLLQEFDQLIEQAGKSEG